ncbi:MAG TPA: NAD-glutamate dehydrogenase [Solirubrobacteraceae bacterium]|nr:NAD-glutamate dehydrogenase [Solirubrobacteraceae bacterium]
MNAVEIDSVLIDAIAAFVRERVSGEAAAQAESLARQYYRWVPAEDLERREPADLAGAAIAIWQLAQQRPRGEIAIRLYNPDGERDGWSSRDTAIEIVCDDMPFLVDSVTMELRRQGFSVHLMIHPVLAVHRDEEGGLSEILPAESDGTLESWLHIEVDREVDAGRLAELRTNLAGVLGQVRAAVEDWSQMRHRLREIADSLESTTTGHAAEEIAETRAFLEWLDEDHFTFLGARDYQLVLGEDGDAALRALPGSGLGILRDAGAYGPRMSITPLSPPARAIALAPHVLVLAKANSRATVHRASYLDYVGVKVFDESGSVVGERRFLGLYTTLSFKQPVLSIPILRDRVGGVLARAGFAPDSHDRKALLDILDSYRPRDELLQIEEDELFEIAMGILAIGERQQVRLFVRREAFERFVSCLVFVPRDRFNTENRERIAAALREAYAATLLDWSVLFSDSVLVRVHFVLGIDAGRAPWPDPLELEERLVAITRTWGDDLRDALAEELGEEEGAALHRRYGAAFSAAYRADWSARSAVADIERCEESVAGGGLGMAIYRPPEPRAGLVRCKLFSAEAPISLSDVLPMFENMGVRIIDERPYEVAARDSSALWIYDLGLRTEHADDFDRAAVRARFQEAFTCVWSGAHENDSLNRLVLEAELRGREITVLRAITKYLRQAGTSLSEGYLQQALIANAEICQLLVALFRARFDPDANDVEDAAALGDTITWAIDAVQSLDHDRILRDYLAVMRAMTRTDYFQSRRGGGSKPTLCFKLDPQQLELLPEPRPRFEVWVYSPRVEAVHLRGGLVARGGIRWSDRREDFRTEVLGLMKAQMVKNALIVPFGAKGGFVVKQPPPGNALHEEVVACYRLFLQSLLDITDNIEDSQLVAPRDVVRYDGDDPYLVVAADKGTATFSDIANAIAAEHDFWLGDAFASGGSHGYDHKSIGITARGAWESVKRHFRELGQDVMASELTVVGIGDMSGDVFGNGMLLSPHIRLIGAFNHSHVFIDPDPDPLVSFDERRRLFELAGSSWADYELAAVSPGGGVFERSAKSIALSEPARARLAIEDAALTPDEVIKALLRAPVDLLWNGGIGTYVKAATETNAAVGDKANDALRVNGGELRCRVVGEGGNLGLTQLGRVEYARTGGRVNTDAIDNAGGVNCSDREVNVKILLDSVVREGVLTQAQRDELLEEMTDEVAVLVLRDSYTQSQALSLAVAQAPKMLDVHLRMIRDLEQNAGFNRVLEALPGDEQIAERRVREEGLTSPELAVLLAHSKISLNAALVDSDLPEDPYLAVELDRYFPHPLPERFPAQMRRHRLRREIISTHVTNDYVDNAGISSAFRLIEETGCAPEHLARAYIVAREAFGLRSFWDEVQALDNIADAQTQIAMLLEARRLVERAARWLVRNRAAPLDIASTIESFAPGVSALAAALPDALEGSDEETYDQLLASFSTRGVPAHLTQRAASMPGLLAALDIVEVAGVAARPLELVIATFFRIGNRFALHWLRDRMTELPRGSRWQGLARAALREDLGDLQRVLTIEVLFETSDSSDADSAVEQWAEQHSAAVERSLRLLADVRASRTYDVTTLSVALREARNLLAGS